MKKNIFILISFLISNILISQTIKKEQIIGTWKVEKTLTETSNPNFKDIIEGFTSSNFRFDENGNFGLSSPNKSKMFLMMLEMVKNKKWKLDNSRQLIKIGSEKDHFSIMEIIVKSSDDKIFFLINESKLEFEMQKI